MFVVEFKKAVSRIAQYGAEDLDDHECWNGRGLKQYNHGVISRHYDNIFSESWEIPRQPSQAHRCVLKPQFLLLQGLLLFVEWRVYNMSIIVNGEFWKMRKTPGCLSILARPGRSIAVFLIVKAHIQSQNSLVGFVMNRSFTGTGFS